MQIHRCLITPKNCQAPSHATRFIISLMLVLTSLNAQAIQTQNTSSESPNTTPIEQGTDEQAEIRYISDDLFTYMRAGPSPDFRLLGSVNAGTKIQLLQVDREAGYAEIIDNRQRQGWVEIRFVSRTPTIREQLTTMQQTLSDKDAELQDMRNEVAAIEQSLAQSEEQKNVLNRRITKQLEEIASLNESIQQRERANNMQWFTRGAILGVIALIIGYIMGMVARKRNRSDRLM